MKKRMSKMQGIAWCGNTCRLLREKHNYSEKQIEKFRNDWIEAYMFSNKATKGLIKTLKMIGC